MARKKKQVVEIFMLLDESGSMSSARLDTIAGVNDYIKQTRDKLPYGRLTIACFDSGALRVVAGQTFRGLPEPVSVMNYRYIYQNQPIGAARLLSTEDYSPNGGTPLRDAQAKLIHHALETVADGVGAIFVTFTDGYENASTVTSDAELKTLIDRCRKQQWEFVFFGANVDELAVADSMGMSRGNSVGYDVKHIGGAMMMASAMTDSYAENYSKGFSNANLRSDVEKTGKKFRLKSE